MTGRPFTACRGIHTRRDTNVNSLVNGIWQRSPGCAFQRFTKAGADLGDRIGEKP